MSAGNGDPDLSGPGKPGNGDLDRRLRSLEERIGRHRGNERDGKGQADAKSGDKTGFGNALRMSSEFISAILVGAGIGFLIDRFAGTSPWGMIFFLLLGFVAGVMNVLRATGQMANPYSKGWASGDASDKVPRHGPSDNGGDDGGR